MTDLRQSKPYSSYLESIGWKTEAINGLRIFIKKIPLLPISIAKVQRPEKLFLSALEPIWQKNKTILVLIEPKSISQAKILEKKRFKLRKSGYLPSKTIIIPLDQSLAKISGQFKKDTRYCLKKAQTQKLIIKNLKTIVEIKGFHQVWKKAVGLNRYRPPLKHLLSLKSIFGENALFLAVGNPIMAGTIILISQNNAYYYYAFNSKQGRKNLAQYLLIWEAIKQAKKRECRNFDFEGIYDQRFPVKSWIGFSHFKKGFSGREIEYPGCFSISRLGKLF